MPTFSWAANTSGNWNTGTLWTPISVPNTATAGVIIDAAATLAAYTASIASGGTLASGLFGAATLKPRAGSVASAGEKSINDVKVRDYRTITSSDQVLTPVTAPSRTRPS
jgi:hypothetical protein